MPKFSHLIFDLDGTLINSKIGLENSCNFMLHQMGLELNSSDIIHQLIGPPIQDGLKNVLGFDEKQVAFGIRFFREYYREKGLFEGELYPGVLEMLEGLYEQSKQLYVATSKKDIFAETALRHFEISRYLVDIQGAGDGGRHTKAELITKLMDRNQLYPSAEVVMIGDTQYDIVGGQANNISTIAVGYGFGNREDLKALNPDYFVEDIEELFDILT